MSPSPYSIQVDATLSDAHELMRSHHIRHLPVLDGDRLVGMVTERDLHLMETLSDVDPDEVTVGEAMTPDPYAVQIGTNLRDVAIALASRKYGSAVVLDGDRVVGVFTTVDALRVLSHLL
ncbi:MAG: CBS domain-containing protein [Deltaproteobacteria bacterium]|nr:MAG: CBS domain-containing protein [Deltaproteobacteria bacterium]